MPPTLRAGIILGLAVAAWTFVMGFTGRWGLFWLVIPLQIGILTWALKGTAAASGYGRQVWTGVSISLLASMLIFAARYLFTSVVFPHYFQELEVLGRQVMARQGLSAEQIEAAVRLQAPMQTHRVNAMAGALGTVVTGFFTSLIAAVWLRKK
ncbi:MAG TPA: DUF4199 domain-containing protein [Geothrix sp.]